MSRFEYKVVIEDLPRKGNGVGTMLPEGIVVHHTAGSKSIQYNNYDVMGTLKAYANMHMDLTGGIPYHIYIPFNDDNYIYVCQNLNTFTWHCSNEPINKKTIAVAVEGYFHPTPGFEGHRPSETQLKKLKQVLDDFPTFFVEKWQNYHVKNINPRDKFFGIQGIDKIVPRLCYHNEAAKPGTGTACCGKFLIPYVVEYREKSGNVVWSRKPEEDPKMIEELTSQKEKLELQMQVKEQMIIDQEAELTSLKKRIEDIEKENKEGFFKQQEEYETKLKTANRLKEQAEDKLKQVTDEDLIEDADYVSKRELLEKEVEKLKKELAKKEEEPIITVPEIPQTVETVVSGKFGRANFEKVRDWILHHGQIFAIGGTAGLGLWEIIKEALPLLLQVSIPNEWNYQTLGFTILSVMAVLYRVVGQRKTTVQEVKVTETTKEVTP
jgi:hypothetical protein